MIIVPKQSEFTKQNEERKKKGQRERYTVSLREFAALVQEMSAMIDRQKRYDHPVKIEFRDPLYAAAFKTAIVERIASLNLTTFADAESEDPDDRRFFLGRLLTVTQDIIDRHNAILAREKAKHEEDKRRSEPIQKQIAAKKAKEAEEKAKRERQADEFIQANRARILAEVEEAKRKLEERRQREREAEKKRKQAKKEFEETRKERAESLEAQRKAKADAAKRQEAQRQSFVGAVIGSLDRMLSEGDPLIAKLKTVNNNKRTTDAERKQILEALDRLGSRAAQTRVIHVRK